MKPDLTKETDETNGMILNIIAALGAYKRSGWCSLSCLSARGKHLLVTY